MGYPDGVMGYKVYDIEHERFYNCNSVEFEETSFHDFSEKSMWENNKYLVFPVDDESDNSIIEQKNKDNVPIPISPPAPNNNANESNIPNNNNQPNTAQSNTCLLYTSPSPRDRTRSRMPSSA